MKMNKQEEIFFAYLNALNALGDEIKKQLRKRKPAKRITECTGSVARPAVEVKLSEQDDPRWKQFKPGPEMTYDLRVVTNEK